jgi:hypothetical protein
LKTGPTNYQSPTKQRASASSSQGDRPGDMLSSESRKAPQTATAKDQLELTDTLQPPTTKTWRTKMTKKIKKFFTEVDAMIWMWVASL